MGKTATDPGNAEFLHGEGAPTPDEARRQLQAILASPTFHGSKRCQQFLEYVCEKALIGETASLKERTVAIDVFGRQPDSGLGEDTIVRVGAREVRKRLAQYYVTPEGSASAIRIDLPPGAYVPEFRYARNAPLEERPATKMVYDQRRWWTRGVILTGGLLLLVAAGAMALMRIGADPNAEAFRRFWEPVLRTPEPLLLAVGHPIVYHASSRAAKLSEERLPPQAFPLRRPIELAPNELDGSDIIPVLNQYVGYGDMVASTEVAAMLARRSKGVHVRLASDVAFADMRQAPTLLIGAFTNRWTMELGQTWRFQFKRAADRAPQIADTMALAGSQALSNAARQWSIPLRDDGSAPEDYILVCRIRNAPSGSLLMVVAGLKQFGTEAAGRLLADSSQLGTILSKLPAGWDSKNLQIVLHAKVIENAPAQPEVVAWHVW